MNQIETKTQTMLQLTMTVTWFVIAQPVISYYTNKNYCRNHTKLHDYDTNGVHESGYQTFQINREVFGPLITSCQNSLKQFFSVISHEIIIRTLGKANASHMLGGEL